MIIKDLLMAALAATALSSGAGSTNEVRAIDKNLGS